MHYEQSITQEKEMIGIDSIWILCLDNRLAHQRFISVCHAQILTVYICIENLSYLPKGPRTLQLKLRNKAVIVYTHYNVYSQLQPFF